MARDGQAWMISTGSLARMRSRTISRPCSPPFDDRPSGDASATTPSSHQAPSSVLAASSAKTAMTFTLAGRGRVPGANDARALHACAVQVVAGITHRRQDEQDADAAQHAADLRSRSALLAATGQSAREQLAAAQAALANLADHTGATPDDRAALVAAARRAVDGISRLVADLSDLSRLHAGALETYLRPVDLDEVVAASLDDLGPAATTSRLAPPRTCPT